MGLSNTYSKGQETDITQGLLAGNQFKAGVRVFEISTRTNSSGKDNSLGDAVLIAGETSATSGYNLNYAFTNIANPMKETASSDGQISEFAIVIPYYDPNDGTEPYVWARQLYNYLSKTKVINGIEIVPFDGNMTVGQARGKILVLSRFSENHDYLNNNLVTEYSTSVGEFLKYTSVVYNWDLEKDRWWNRGYDVTEKQDGLDYGGIYPAMWEVIDEAKNQWQWTGKQAVGNDKKSAKPTNEYGYEDWRWEKNVGIYTLGFNFSTYHIFDWERVCESEGRYSHQNVTAYTNHYFGTYWYESKAEKLDYTKKFMDQGISALKTASSGDDVYINSLRGYYIVSDGLSALPYAAPAIPDAGRHGDIPSYTQYINGEINEYINNKKPNERGPLGIMLMNFAGTGENAFPTIPGMDMHGDDLLQTIIDNNFRFLLNTSKAE